CPAACGTPQRAWSRPRAPRARRRAARPRTRWLARAARPRAPRALACLSRRPSRPSQRAPRRRGDDRLAVYGVALHVVDRLDQHPGLVADPERMPVQRRARSRERAAGDPRVLRPLATRDELRAALVRRDLHGRDLARSEI